ncbi:hypothetical protein [Sphingomonas sp.]|uniref:hypothetical protein n=1 Tax=Sphingomonas sp. TaxID=28214 RepID=UPI001B0A2411|nr:hypothetical protein [Sphingomonas sp.]MBO9712442.1 hypothetical protein [Sphingomonas sp.]
MKFPLSGLAVAAALLAAAPAQAQDPQNAHPWDFRDRGAPLATATLMWQVERAEKGGGSAIGGAGNGGAGLPSTTSVANMTVVNVTVGDNSRADVKVHSDQSNIGDVNSTAVVATGNVVDIGTIGSGNGG